MRIFAVGNWVHFGSLVVSLALLRFGLELRAYETLISPVSGTAYGNAFSLQALLSVRAEF